MKKRYVLPSLFRFKAKVDSKTGCWLWHPRDGRASYGQLRIDGKQRLAHRASWLAHKGEIPEGLFVCHKCDTRNCVNPDHLFLGTAEDNWHDCVNKKRAAFHKAGFDFAFTRKSRTRKLSASDVEIIRASTAPLKELATRFSVSMACISLVRRGKRKTA